MRQLWKPQIVSCMRTWVLLAAQPLCKEQVRKLIDPRGLAKQPAGTMSSRDSFHGLGFRV